MSLAQRGFAVVNFSYRLAPEVKFPASLEDTNRVFSWVLTHGEEYGLDTEHIFGAGDSAGGNLLALYSCICTNPEYAAEYDFKPPAGFAPTAVGLNCATYRIALGEGGSDELTQALMADYLPGQGTVKELELVNVPNHVTENFPPAFMMTCPGDFLKTQSTTLAKKLLEKDVPFVYRLYGSAKNPLAHVFHCDIRSADAKLCGDEECAFFRKFI